MIACLLIHGYTGGPHEVEPLANYLKEKTTWDIFVPTLPGHGKSLSLKNITHLNWLEEAETVFKRLKQTHDQIFLVGFSMGGMIASYLAGKYEADKLVLLAPSRKFISFRRMSVDIGGVIIDGIKGNLGENEMYTKYKKKIGAVPLKANVEFLRLVKYTKKYLKKIKAPVFIAQGRQDEMVPAKTVYYLDKEIPSDQMKVVLFEDSNHQICWGDDKDTLNQMVYNFLLENK